MARSNEEVTLLGPDSRFEGKLNFGGRVHIDGAFKGQIKSQDTLMVGQNGVLEGEIEVGTIIAHGTIRGSVNAHTLIELHAPAKVYGKIMTPNLIIEKGVVFEGECRMEKLDKADESIFKPAETADKAAEKTQTVGAQAAKK